MSENEKNINLIDSSTDYYYTENNNISNEQSSSASITTISTISTHQTSSPISHNIPVAMMIKLIANKNIQYIKELLEQDKIDKYLINLNDSDGETLLHFSIFSDSYEMTRMFLKYGADPNKRDKEGQTPIFRIVFATDEKIIGLLLEYGAILDIQDSEGNTPLHIAVLTKNYKIIKSLLDYGVNPLIHNKNNLISIDFAVSKVGGKFSLDEKILAIFSSFV